ncbi:hypothetical protein [Streptomyces sp. NPDC057253]
MRIGSCPRARVQGGGRGGVSQAGAVLLVETVRKSGQFRRVALGAGEERE